MEGKKIKVTVATPDAKIYDDVADMIIVKTCEGEIGILPGHMPIITLLDIGTLHIKICEDEKIATVNRGFLQFMNDEVTIFTDSAEWPEDIDLERAKKAKERAEERLRRNDIDKKRAEYALKRAINRINLKEI